MNDLGLVTRRAPAPASPSQRRGGQRTGMRRDLCAFAFTSSRGRQTLKIPAESSSARVAGRWPQPCLTALVPFLAFPGTCVLPGWVPAPSVPPLLPPSSRGGCHKDVTGNDFPPWVFAPGGAAPASAGGRAVLLPQAKLLLGQGEQQCNPHCTGALGRASLCSKACSTLQRREQTPSPRTSPGSSWKHLGVSGDPAPNPVLETAPGQLLPLPAL